MKILAHYLTISLFALLPAGAQTSYVATVLADKPNAYWRMGDVPGSPVAIDVAGPYTATVRGNVSFGQTGVLQNNAAVAMDGTGYFLTALRQTHVVQYSLEAWVNTIAATAPILQDRGYDETTNGYALSITMSVGWVNAFDGKLHCGLDGQDVYLSGATQTLVNDGTWHHFVCVFNGVGGQPVTPQQFTLYVDGQPQTLDYTSIGSAVAPVNGSGGTTIGIHPIWQRESPEYPEFVGFLDEVAVYHYALTSSQVLSHYQAASCPHGC